MLTLPSLASETNSANPSSADCIHHLFERQVARTPHNIALEFAGHQLTYRQLDERANQWAWRLRELGVGPDVLVGLCVERSLELVVVIYAILKAGGAYVPLDPHLPAARLALILDDAAPAVLITQHSLASRCADFTGPRFWIDADISACPVSSPAVAVSPCHASYVIYTSGSTGRPKGVLLEHGATVNFLHATPTYPGVRAHDVVLSVTTMSFDMSVFDWFAPLVCGARLIIGPDHLRSEGAALLAVIRDRGVTMIHAAPSIWKSLLDAGWPGSPDFKALVGGEALPSDLARRLLAACAEVWNLYGPTETTVFSMASRVTDPGDITIGTAMPNMRLHVVDDQLHPVPVGGEGELLIGGPALARGYLNLPALTAERFIPDPFSSQPGERLYRTGDLCRPRADGQLDYLGRIDTQVKLQGFRIELGEIEAALRAIDGVLEAAVSLRTDADGGKFLAAFLAAHPGTPLPSVATLRVSLSRRLPGYMVPARFIPIDRLPLTANRKVDRLALAALPVAELPSHGSQPDPLADVAATVLAVWREVLGQDSIGLRDNFFDLGGHSLLAVVICSRLSRQLDRPVRVRWLFEHPVLAEFAHHVESLAGHEAAGDSVPLADRSQPLPVSFAQQGMWLLDQLLSVPAAYNIPAVFRVSGPLDRPALLRALRSLMIRHEILRTSIGHHDGQLVQRVAAPDALSVPFSELPLPASPPAGLLEAARALLTDEVNRRFDLEQAPQWRVMLVSLAADDHLLAFNFHHGIVDEWSSRIFAKELSALYAAGGHLEAAGLPALPVHYADYSAWQRRQLTGEHLARLQSYWLAQLADFPPPAALPFSRSRKTSPTGQGAGHSFQLGGDLVRGLRKLARIGETTVFTVMLAAFHTWLYRMTGQDDVIVSTPVTRRNQSDLLHLLGMFINTVPIRARLAGRHDFKSVLRALRATTAESFDHADLPFEQLVALVMPDRDPVPYPLHQVMFVLFDEPPPTLQLAQTATSRFSLPVTANKNDLTLLIEAIGDTWQCRFEYAADILDPVAIDRLAGRFIRLLHSIIADPGQPIDTLELFSESAHPWMIDAPGAAGASIPVEDSSFCLHHRFEQQAARTPDAVALVYQNDSLTYGELNRRADHLALRLRRLGAQPDVLVGLWLEPSIDLLVGLLGILKAGAAYLPIDPRYPHDRAAFMLSDSRAVALVTDTRTAASLPSLGAPLVLVDDPASFSAPADDLPPPAVPPVGPDHMAYVIYTSGTTGRPKGVIITHRNVARLFTQTAPWFAFDEHDVWSLFHSIAFDFSVWEVWGAWLYGGRLVIVDPLVRRTPSAFRQLLSSEKITVLSQTPSAFVQLIAADEQAVASPLALRFVVFGGEALDMPVLRPWFDRHGDEYPRLVNMYGITETTVHVTYRPVTRADLDAASVIGRPIPDLVIHLLDTHLKPVPPGVEGEICVGGAGLARGYLNRPELTAERFAPDPFSPETGARLYRSGDLARRRADGDLEYLGRIDHQVKIRGHRVELGEIETALAAHPQIRQAVVLVSRDTSGSNQLTAYLVAPDTPASGELRRWLLRTLPDYMVPARFIALPAFPLTSNGKVDRRALPDPSAAIAPAAPDAEPPRVGLETTLAQVWCELFRRPAVSRHDNFFELGGHSLLAARLMVEIEKATGLRIPISALFKTPTIAALTHFIHSGRTHSTFTSLVPLQTKGTLPALFCVHGWGGDAYGFVHLARALAPARPVYGLQAIGLDGQQSKHTSVEEMAAHYVREMRLQQPRGPYHIIGYSLGGWIAYAVAQELVRQGETVALLGMLETDSNARLPLRAFLRTRALRQLQSYIKYRNTSARKFFHLLGGDQVLFRISRLRHRLGLVPPASVAPAAPRVHAYTRDYFCDVVSRYRAPAYTGDLDVFLGDDSISSHRHLWKYLVRGKITLRPIPGRHHELVDLKNIADFTAQLRLALAQAEAALPPAATPR